MELCVMGAVGIRSGADLISLPRGGERCVLATLALSPGRRLHLDVLVENLWGDRPPDSAEQTVATYVRTVRRAIEQAGGDRSWLRNHRPGAYELAVDPEWIDYFRFRSLVSRARGGDPAGAVDAYARAVGVRRGEALADVPGEWAERRRWAIEQEYVEALCAMYEQQLVAGAHDVVAASVADLVTQLVPTDRMLLLGAQALARSGRHAQVPELVRQAEAHMWDVAGVRPGPEVRDAIKQLLARPEARLTGNYQDDKSTPHVVMTVHNAARVYQAAGDQIIVESDS